MITGEDVKNLRRLLKLKQRELAEKLGVSVGTIANYEAGGVIPMNKQLMIDRMLTNAGGVTITGDGNITHTGTTGGDVFISADQEVFALRKRIAELEKEVKALKDDKAILQEFITILKTKDKQ